MILEIGKELEGYTRLDEIDGKSYNIWINNNILKEVLEEFDNNTQYEMIGFEGNSHNMSFDTHYECDCFSSFEYENTIVYKAIEYLEDDMHYYLVEEDENDYVEVLIDNIIKK